MEKKKGKENWNITENERIREQSKYFVEPQEDHATATKIHSAGFMIY